jgi:rhodanese-related sulfurtransferase
MTRTLLTLPLAAALLACTPRTTPHRAEPSAAAGGATHRATPRVVDAATALSLAASGARVVDVRTPQEFADGHVPGAVNVPYDQIGSRLAEVGPKDAPIVLYCRSGRRSAVAAEALRGHGYTDVYDAQRYDGLAEASKGG